MPLNNRTKDHLFICGETGDEFTAFPCVGCPELNEGVNGIGQHYGNCRVNQLFVWY